ncbi:hypothetical protein KQX54_008460 [Cotesia glomerata]|uniref:Uncharacterized protein n=1 Tax=Cotesia glomerata TaxID=32391 RepID=A0AAV7IMY1_COTGL|nr:hypothetical protein KQX54_008460 [Cotesia glomerata]
MFQHQREDRIREEISSKLGGSGSSPIEYLCIVTVPGSTGATAKTLAPHLSPVLKDETTHDGADADAGFYPRLYSTSTPATIDSSTATLDNPGYKELKLFNSGMRPERSLAVSQSFSRIPPTAQIASNLEIIKSFNPSS